MPTEVKQRKKPQKQSDEASESVSGKDEAQKTKTQTAENAKKASTSPDFKGVMCLLSLAACAALSWVVLQHNQRFSQMEEKYRSLQGRTSRLFDMEEEVLTVSKKWESVQLMLEGVVGAHQQGALRPQLEAVEQEVVQLKEWASSLSEKRSQLQGSLTALRGAVGLIEERTNAIAKDFANKVASVRTDVRRMDGLRSELDSLLVQVGELEERSAQVERGMVRRIGDLLAGSIDRVSNLRSASERNTQAIERLRGRLPELAAADHHVAEQLRELQAGRARLIKTVTFAGDLKPKVATIKRDFRGFEPRLSDLTERIGQLAEDLMEREREIAELRQTLTNLTAAEGDDITTASQHVGEFSDLSDIREMNTPV